MNNIMEVKFSAKSENESLARVIVASFAAKLDRSEERRVVK